MQAVGRRTWVMTVVGLAVLAAVLLHFGRSPNPPAPSDSLPDRLTDGEFWQMVTDFSESDGYFQSDNFLSNETSYQEIIPLLQRTVAPGGVYMGVGPEQNFTYIGAFAPKLAFIVDIRRQNMLELLLYKAFMEMSQDRADFLSRLFARPRPPELEAGASVEALFDAYAAASPDHDLFETYLGQALEHLTETHGFTLSQDDQSGIRYVYNAFFSSGPGLTYSFLSPGGGFGYRGAFMPSYADLMKATDGSDRNWSFLANENQFAAIQRLQHNNAIVPLVGDFAGKRAIRSVGRYLKDRDARVSVFYTSNVEQYLFRSSEDWRHFYDNVFALPVHPSAAFVRSVLNRGPGGSRWRGWSRTVWSPIGETLAAYQNGKVRTYAEVISISHSN